LVVWPRCSSVDSVAGPAADAALIDEARAILGPWRTRPRQRPAEGRSRGERPDTPFWPIGLDPSPEPLASGPAPPSDEVRSFGHIVIDEAQDLSPMQLRMLARRSLSGSMTVVGDIAQATGAWTPKSWDEVATHLSPRHPPRLVELTVSYRTPAEVVAVAARALRAAVPDLEPPTPVRRSGHVPVIERMRRPELAGRAAGLAAELLAILGPGKVAVLAPEAMVAELSEALSERGLDPVDPRDPAGQGLAAPLVLLPAAEAHGLEFDGVVVVEPAALVGDAGGEGPADVGGRGMRTLYVALTRPTQRLAVVHALPLPVALDDV
jgi:DNA helicase IV